MIFVPFNRVNVGIVSIPVVNVFKKDFSEKIERGKKERKRGKIRRKFF